MHKQMISDIPELVAQWHPERNEDLNINQVRCGSHKKVWWQCASYPEHEWLTSPHNRTSTSKYMCPFCCGYKVSITNCLTTQFPHIAAEWSAKNSLLPTQVTAKSSKKAWWQGKCGHEWFAVIGNRTSGSGCPYCAIGGKRLACLDNCLATTHSELAKEWHPEKNVITAFDITSGSKQMVWWRGKCGHEWNASPNDRVGKGCGCPFCSGRRVSPENSLAINYPEIASEWHPLKNENLTPESVTQSSGRMAWWICNQGHEYKQTIANRVWDHGCPICINPSRGEAKIRHLLEKMNIQFVPQYKFDNCRNKRPLPFDFAIINPFKLIEYQGEQHYRPIRIRGMSLERAAEKFIITQKHDAIKRTYCQTHGIELLVIPYWAIDKIDKILINALSL